MLERAERISFKISSVLSKVEPQPDIRYTPASAPTKKYRLRNTGKEPQKTNKKTCCSCYLDSQRTLVVMVRSHSRTCCLFTLLASLYQCEGAQSRSWQVVAAWRAEGRWSGCRANRARTSCWTSSGTCSGRAGSSSWIICINKINIIFEHLGKSL